MLHIGLWILTCITSRGHHHSVTRSSRTAVKTLLCSTHSACSPALNLWRRLSTFGFVRSCPAVRGGRTVRIPGSCGTRSGRLCRGHLHFFLVGAHLSPPPLHLFLTLSCRLLREKRALDWPSPTAFSLHHGFACRPARLSDTPASSSATHLGRAAAGAFPPAHGGADGQDPSPGTPSAYRRVPSGYLLFSFTSDFLKAWSRLVTSLS